jgi:hypothetical protein
MRNSASYCSEVNRKTPVLKAPALKAPALKAPALKAPVVKTPVVKESDTVEKSDSKFFERVKLVMSNVSERCSSKRDDAVDRKPIAHSSNSNDSAAQLSPTVRKKDEPIPTPGSIDCIWRQELQRIAGQKSNSVKRNDVPILINSEDIDDEYTAALDSVVASVLEDTTTFPGHVCSALHSLFLNLKFSCDKEILEHARECLDAIACSLLSVLPVESTPDNSHNVENIVRSVDRHVLGLSHRAMYCKAFLAAYLISAENDQKLKYRNLQKHEEHITNSTIPCEHCDYVTLILLHTSQLLSPRDKLSQLRKAVQVISNSANKHTCRGIDRVFIRGDPLGVIQSTGESQEDTDSLIEIVSNVIVASEYPISRTATQNKVYWFAECTYIDSMMREGDWALGIESYALTTVMQSLQSIIQ